MDLKFGHDGSRESSERKNKEVEEVEEVEKNRLLKKKSASFTLMVCVRKWTCSQAARNVS